MDTNQDSFMENLAFALMHTREEGVKLQIESFIYLLIDPIFPCNDDFKFINIELFKRVIKSTFVTYLNQPFEIISEHEQDFYQTFRIMVSITKTSLSKIKPFMDFVGQFIECGIIQPILSFFHTVPKFIKIEIIKFMTELIELKMVDVPDQIIESGIIKKMITCL